MARYHWLTRKVWCWQISFILGACIAVSARVVGQNHHHTPPGAVGGRYGSGCLNFCSSFSVSMNSTCSVIGSACGASLKILFLKGVAPSVVVDP
jgi:hypothetical protein